MKIAATHKSFGVYILLGIIVFLGSYLRLSGIFTNSFAYTYDVGRDLLAVRNIVVGHHIPLIGPTTGIAGLYYGPWWYYILIFPFIFFGGNPQGIVFFIACTGILTIILSFYLGKKQKGNFFGLILASLVAVSPYLIGLSSQIWNPNISPILLLVFLILLIKYLDKKYKKASIIAFFIGFILGLMLDAEIVFGINLLIAFFLFFVFLSGKKLFIKTNLYIVCGFFITLLPRTLFEFRHSFVMTRQLFTHSSGASPLFQLPTKSILVQRLSFFNNLFADTITNGDKVLSIIVCVICLIFLILVFKKFTQSLRSLLVFLSSILLVFFINLSLFSHDIFNHYVVGIPLVYVVLISLAIGGTMENTRQKITAVFSTAILFWINLQPMTLLAGINKPLWEGDAAVYRNQLAVVDFVYHKAHGEHFNYIVYTPPVYDYTYQYLFAWYGEKTYGYTPSKEKKSLFFVILEPDYQYPSRLQQWLDIRKNDGKILLQQVVKGGISVQERIH